MGFFCHTLPPIKQEDYVLQKYSFWPTPKLSEMFAAWVDKEYKKINKIYYNTNSVNVYLNLNKWLRSAFDKKDDEILQNNQNVPYSEYWRISTWIEEKWRMHAWEYEDSIAFFESMFYDAIDLLYWNYGYKNIIGKATTDVQSNICVQNTNIRKRMICFDMTGFEISINGKRDELGINFVYSILSNVKNSSYDIRKNGNLLTRGIYENFYIPDPGLMNTIIKNLKEITKINVL